MPPKGVKLSRWKVFARLSNMSNVSASTRETARESQGWKPVKSWILLTLVDDQHLGVFPTSHGSGNLADVLGHSSGNFDVGRQTRPSVEGEPCVGPTLDDGREHRQKYHLPPMLVAAIPVLAVIATAEGWFLNLRLRA